MTWIEVVDSAIKIGLGALIAGFFADRAGRIARKHEVSKEYIKFKRELLMQISADCNVFHRRLLDVEKWVNNDAHGRILYVQELFAIEANIILLDEPSAREAYDAYSGLASIVISRSEKMVKAEVEKVNSAKIDFAQVDMDKFTQATTAILSEKIVNQLGDDFSNIVDSKRELDSELAKAMKRVH